MVDMDRLAAQEYTSDVIIALSKSIAEAYNTVRTLEPEEAVEIVERARTGAVGIPQMIINAMQEVGADV